MPYTEQRGRKWRVRWNTWKKDERGRWIYDGKSGFDSELEAYHYGLDQESAIRNNRYISPRDGRMLMKDYMRTWLDTMDVGHLRERSVRSYSRLYIEPRWGETAVGDIKATEYRAWEKQLRAQPNISSRYADEILRVFSMMMDDAVDDEMRQSSPVQKHRKRGRYVKKPRERKRDMRMEDVHALACNALVFWGFPGYVFILTAAYTGMRPAELYALRREYCCPNWPASDPRENPEDEDRYVDDAARYGGETGMPAVRVQHQVQFKDGQLQTLPPKYESCRSLVVPDFLAELFTMLLASHSSEWVFPSVNDGPIGKANFTYHYWRKIADGRKAGDSPKSRRPLPAIPPVPAYAGKRLYLLRHGHKQWIDEGGHSRVATEARMGHELGGVEGVYASVTVPMERAIMESLQARWLRFVGSLEPDWLPSSPTPLPVDLHGWMELQVKKAPDAD